MIPKTAIYLPTDKTFFTANILQSIDTLLAPYANDTAILATNANPNKPKLVTNLQQNQANKIVTWTKQWRILKNQRVSHLL